MSRLWRWPALMAALFMLLACLGASGQQAPGAFHMLIGCRVAHFDHPPVIGLAGRTCVSAAVLDELEHPGGPAPPQPTAPLGGRAKDQETAPQAGTAAPGSAEAPEPGNTQGKDEQGAGGTAAPIAPAPPQPGWHHYILAEHVVDVSPAGAPFAVQLDGKPLAAAEIAQYQGQGYIDAGRLADAGLLLAYDAEDELYQLTGAIYRLDYRQGSGDAAAAAPSLSLSCLTPLGVEGVQDDETHVHLVLHGGYFAESSPREYPGDPVVTKVGLKSLPRLGRSYVYLEQPKRTGFKVASEERLGFAVVSFGNYFRVANYSLSSSGQLSLCVQLGAPAAAQDQALDNPPRLVVDFAGAIFEDATRTIKVNQGGVTAIRIGTPAEGHVRVVLDLAEPLDYRLLTNDNGARYYVQLLPRTPPVGTASQMRKGRAIMLDPGHGGSDPGAPGVGSGVWESALTLRITALVQAELSRLGYQVLSTRRADRFVSLGARTDYANSVLPYVFVSIHCNSIEDPSFEGIMTFYHASSAAGARLAACVHSEALAATGAVDKGVRTANFFVLRETVMPATLIECGFLTSKGECAKLTDPAYQARLAHGIARGIDKFVTGGI